MDNFYAFKTALGILTNIQTKLMTAENVSLKRKAAQLENIRKLKWIIQQNHHAAMTAKAMADLRSADDLVNERYANHVEDFDENDKMNDAGDPI